VPVVSVAVTSLAKDASPICAEFAPVGTPLGNQQAAVSRLPVAQSR
jgi:hypothetical protein